VARQRISSFDDPKEQKSHPSQKAGLWLSPFSNHLQIPCETRTYSGDMSI
jgi:hypothetical protein